jgi:hypothetical protein
MTSKGNAAQADVISSWEDEGGAAPSDSHRSAENAQATSDRHAAERNGLDASHDSAARGEHRYPDTHQTASEQHARRDRDDLKRRLGGYRR